MDAREKTANEKRLVDANELKKKMCFKCNDEYSDEPCDPSDCVFCNAINDAQTIDAVPVRHGRWIWRNKWEPFEFKYECSICHDSSDLESKYCPNCGAKMDKEDSECDT